MKHSELITTIARKTGKTPKLKVLAEILDKPVGTINSRASRDLKYDYDEVEKIKKFYNIEFTDLETLKNSFIKKRTEYLDNKNDISLDKPLCEDYDGNQLVLSDILPSDEDVEEKTVDEPADRQMINELISKLNHREREIMILRYGLMGHEELTQREVALKLGISQSYISRLEKRILNDMKLQLQKVM